MISDNSNSLKINNTLLLLYSTTGIVADTSIRSETEVSGSGGGGIPNTHPGSGQSSPMHFKVESKTTRYQDFFLIDEDKKEHVFNLVDFLVSCRKGNLLTVIWGIKPNKNHGPYFAVYNHDTQKISYDNYILAQYCRPKFLPIILYPILMIVCIVLGIYIAALLSGGMTGVNAIIMPAVFGLIGAIVGIKAGWSLSKVIINKITNKKISQFKISANWKYIIESVSNIKKDNYKGLVRK